MKQKTKLPIYIVMVVVMIAVFSAFIGAKANSDENRRLANYNTSMRLREWNIKVTDAIFDKDKSVAEFTILRTSNAKELTPINLKIGQENQTVDIKQIELFALSDGISGYAVRVKIDPTKSFKYLLMYFESDKDITVPESTDEYGNAIAEENTVEQHSIHVMIDRKSMEHKELPQRKSLKRKIEETEQTLKDIDLVISNMNNPEDDYSTQITELNTKLEAYQTELNSKPDVSVELAEASQGVAEQQGLVDQWKQDMEAFTADFNARIAEAQKTLDEMKDKDEKKAEQEQILAELNTELETKTAEQTEYIGGAEDKLVALQAQVESYTEQNQRRAELEEAIEVVTKQLEGIQEELLSSDGILSAMDRIEAQNKQTKETIKLYYEDGIAEKYNAINEEQIRKNKQETVSDNTEGSEGEAEGTPSIEVDLVEKELESADKKELKP